MLPLPGFALWSTFLEITFKFLSCHVKSPFHLIERQETNTPLLPQMYRRCKLKKYLELIKLSHFNMVCWLWGNLENSLPVKIN